LQEKSVVAVDHYVPTTGRAAKAFKATVTTAQYLASQVLELDVSIPDLLCAISEGTKNRSK